jgi:hypothetical protein
MTTFLGAVTRPAAGTGARARSLRKTGLVLGGVGVGIAMLGFLAGLNAASLASSEGAADEIATSLVLAFGLSIAGFATIKLGIGVVLLAIVRRLWVRLDAVRVALPALTPRQNSGPEPQAEALGDYDSPFGPATAAREKPGPLPIHRVAKLMWAPMLAMGAMLAAIGLLVSFVAAGSTSTAGVATSEFAWAQGLLFLGETSLLAGVSFLLGTILASIRTGAGEVQQGLGVTVRTLRMPTTAKIFVGLMMAGVIVGIVQFLGYVIVASADDPSQIATAFAWLGPLREFGLGLLLAGIVLALATIATALGFQFDRITSIIKSGR